MGGVEVSMDEVALCRLWREGWIYQDIADELGVSRTSVQRRVKKLNLPARSNQVMARRRADKELELPASAGEWRSVGGVKRWIAS